MSKEMKGLKSFIKKINQQVKLYFQLFTFTLTAPNDQIVLSMIKKNDEKQTKLSTLHYILK
jgi:hypothetical protein